MFETLFGGYLERLFDSAPQHTIIIGADAMGRLLAADLTTAGRTVSLIDTDAVACQLTKKLHGVNVIRGDATDHLVLRRAGAAYTKYLFAMTPSDELNLRICQVAHAEFSIPKLIARIDSSFNPSGLEARGIETADWMRAAPIVLDNVLPGPILLRVLKMNAEDEHVAEIEVDSPVVIGQTLSSLPLEDCEVLELRRDDSLITPEKSTALQIGDALTLVGGREAIARARAQLRANC